MILYIVIGLAVFTFWILTRRRNGSTIPGPRGFPVIGNSLEVNPETFHFKLHDWAKEYGPIFKCNAMGIDMIILSKPELVRKAYGSDKYGKIFNDRAPSFLAKYIFKDQTGIIFGGHNETTYELRKVFHTGLHFYGDGIEAFENNFHKEIERLIDTIAKTEGQDFDPRPLFERSLGNLLTILLCGEPMDGKDEEVVWNFVNTVSKVMTPTYEFYMYNFPFLRFTPGYFGNIYRMVSQRLSEFIQRYFVPYKNTYVPGSERGIVDVFLKLQAEQEAAGPITWVTDGEIRGLVQATIGGGLLTTSNNLLAIFLVLTRYPDCLTKIYDEVTSVVGTGRLPRLSDKQHMPYTEAAILECQRITNLIPIPMPHNCFQNTIFEGYKIKKDTRILARP